MSENGRLPDSELSPIPGGRLLHEPAAAWNAMLAEARARGMAQPMTDGPASSYRTYAQQVELRNEWCGRGECQNAAVPGTSNHGRGSAVDCGNAEQQRTIDLIGHKYGWDRGYGGWSGAPWEPWHCVYQPGHYKPRKPVQWPFLPLRYPHNRGKGVWVRMLTRRLRDLGYHETRLEHHKRVKSANLIKVRTSFDESVKDAVERFQKLNHLKPDGVVGPVTWAHLKTNWLHRKRKGR